MRFDPSRLSAVRRIFFFAVFFCLAAAWAENSAFAVSLNDAEASSRTLIIGGTVGVALIIGLILYQFSLRSSRVQFKSGQAGSSDEGDQPAGVPQNVSPAILREISRLAGPSHRQQQVARAVSEIVMQTVEQQVNVAKQEFTQRASQLAQEHRRETAVLERKYHQTLTEKKQTSAVLESIAEGLVVVNSKGNVVMMNPAAEKLLGVKPGERIGKSISVGLREEQLVSMVQSTETGEREIVLSAKQDSTKKVLRASNAVVSDENGNTVGMVAVLSDVTKQRELDEMKSDFVSKVSHELRTPIVAMRHSLSILIDQIAGPLSEEQQKFLDISQRNLDRLSHLINDLLDLSKLEAKKMELRLSEAPIAPVIRSVVDTMGPWAQSKGITLAVHLPDGLPDTVMDAGRLTQVITNLIGNAIKFTPSQGKVTVEAKPSGGAFVEVSISDTGVGIAPEDIPKLFNKFQQVGERSSSDISGTGLGLAISKEIIDLHRGRIWAESQSQGARFVFTVPAAGNGSEKAA